MNAARLHITSLWWALPWLALWLAGCGAGIAAVPTRAIVAALPGSSPGLPPTFTPAATVLPTASATILLQTPLPSLTPLPIPTNTPVPPSPTPTETPTPAPLGTPTPVIKPIDQYDYTEVIPVEAFPTPPHDNGWGMHWIPTVKQDRGVVDRFVAELARMHIKWVVFLNDGTNIGDNDYLVERLVASGMMPDAHVPVQRIALWRRY